MAYTRTNWQDKPSTLTPITAARLNNIESGVADAHAQLDGPISEARLNDIESGVADAHAKIDGPIAARASAATKRQAPSPMGDISTSNPEFTDIVGMLPDGRRKVFTGPDLSAAQIGVSEDGVTFTWGENFGGANVVTGVIPTPGGEVLVAVKALDNANPGTVRRSTGWDPSNADATSWATVLTASKTGAHMDGRWCLTERSVAPLNSPGAGAIFLCEYDGDRAWMSVDDGVTWAQIFDLQTLRPGANHVHAIAYDKWDDRVWVTVGDTSFAGIYYVDRAKISGTSTPWTLLPGSDSAAWQVTTVVPLSNSVVFLSKASDSGVFAAPRDGVRDYKPLRNVVDLPDAGLIGAHAYQAADDLPAFLTFNQSGSGQTPRIIATIDGEHFSTVYTDTWTVAGSSPGVHSIVGPDLDGNVWAVRNTHDSVTLLKAPTASSEGSPVYVSDEEPTAAPGVMWLNSETGTLSRYDERMTQWVPYGVSSSAWGGDHESITMGRGTADTYGIAIGIETAADGYGTVAIGYQTTAHDSSAVAIGNGAEAQGSRNLAIGVDATAGDPETTWDSGAVALGSGAVAHGNSSVALGGYSKTWDAEATALGNRAAASRSGVAIGYNTNSGCDYAGALTGVDSTIAIGSFANAASLRATAIGANSQATHEQSAALGAGAYANGDDAIAIGDADATAARSIAIGKGASAYVEAQAVIAAHEFVVEPRYDEIGNETTPGVATSVVLYSPNGSQWRITVDDTGTLGATEVV